MNTAASKNSSFLDILDRTFRIYRENFVPIVGYVALVSIPVAILDVLLTRSLLPTNLSSFQTGRSASADVSGSAFLYSLLILLLSLVELVLNYAVVSYVTSETYLGRSASISQAFNATRSRLTQLGCGFVLFYIVIFLFAFAIVFIASICNAALVGFVIVGYIALATFTLLTPVFTLENVGASRGINRAYGLGRVRFWTMLGVLAVIYLISLILGVAVGAVLGLLGLGTTGDPLSSGPLIRTVATTAINILVTPLFPIAMTLLYYAARTRSEGLDLALAAVDKPDPRPSDVAPASSAPFLTSRDLINMVILGVCGFALSLVAGGLLAGILNSVAPGLTLPR